MHKDCPLIKSYCDALDRLSERSLIVTPVGDFLNAYYSHAYRLSRLTGLTLTGAKNVPTAGFGKWQLTQIAEDVKESGVTLFIMDLNEEWTDYLIVRHRLRKG